MASFNKIKEFRNENREENGNSSDKLFVEALGEILVEERACGLDKIIKYKDIYQVRNQPLKTIKFSIFRR